ncbi:MAG: hypothetical protein BGO51_04665 [Rhodospirillales bacterium 69-11]|mgnify:CR=1 FL=1|nr:MAG: hypothetical protein BGO51_04665 [Rhodospirillales bacterium 69-11]
MPAEMVPLVGWMQQRAAALDRDAAFPGEEVARLRGAGALTVPLPVATPTRDDAAADRLASVLMLTGEGNLPVARVLEAHLNALHLIARFGGPARLAEAVAATEGGALFALWVTDPPEGALRAVRAGATLRLEGGKQFCSAAGHATHALVTAEMEDGRRMLVLRLSAGERVTPLPAPLQGMRAALTGAVDFTGCEVPDSALLGAPGDYLREPDFSAGAWRGSAAAAGGLIALVDATIAQLRSSGRFDSPHTRARVGTMLAGREAARLWVQAAARCAEDPAADTDHRVATVGLARIAVERACLEAMQLAQRSLGLTAFRVGNPVERICRDLATYLRQPAPDEVLTEAATWFATHPTATVLR